MNEGKTHFADDATLKYMGQLIEENKTLREALKFEAQQSNLEKMRMTDDLNAYYAMLKEIVDAWEGCRPLDDWNAAMHKAKEMLK